MSLFAVMVHERAPLQIGDLPGLAAAWVQDAGGFAAVGLAIWLLAYLVNREAVVNDEPWSPTRRAVFGMLLSCAGAGYLVYFVLRLMAWSGSRPSGLLPYAVTLGGAFALASALFPFLIDLPRLRWRRIGALAHLSFKEARSSKLPYVFSLLIVVCLVADWFLPHKPENQLRTFVQVMYWAMTPLLLLSGMILASFGIPNDLRHQTLYTVVTKPVERFEIIAGRFLGYVGLLSALLLVMTSISLLYITIYGVHPDAERESWRARVPIYGQLVITGMPGGEAGVQVGREWDYRRYIPGGPGSPVRANWLFNQLPDHLDQRATVPCEFTFQVFRMERGVELKGVLATLSFESWRWNPADKPRYQEDLAKALNAPNRPPLAQIYNQLAETYGYYEVPAKEVFDKQVLIVDVPAGLFKNARKEDAQRKRELTELGVSIPAPVTVAVKCDNEKQFLGMATHDLYLVDAEGWFAWNFYKGALGLWFRLCLVIGVATACSTYLSGVVSLLATQFLFVAGLCRPFITAVATNNAEGGGPAEAFLRLAQRQNLTTPLEQTPTLQTANVFDEVFRWVLQRVLNFIPDVDRLDLSAYVAEGFDIGAGDLLVCALLVAGYLIPWAVLAYYLMKTREVAS